ncbi:MAG: DNA gyrase subunit A [Pseudomonadota bacterium]
MPDNKNTAQIKEISIDDEMRNSYLDYAMSVIVSRAIPDARDGLKPVHRRILYTMYESNFDYNKPFKKSARIVGEVMGKYHPHGDTAIYDSLVRMAQDFSLRVPLIDGQGNFGSMDGDSPAAMRYTESRLEKVSHTMLADIDKETVKFQENYDGSEFEPTVLPARFPNLLINGAGGIAVGMATNIPTFNLGEIIDLCCAYIDNNDITIEEILQILPGPDFPTGAVILGRAASHSAIATGRGSIIIRGKAEIEDISANKKAIIVTEIPYQVNKSKMIEKMAELVKDKRIEGISDIRDESNKQGVRVVIELKRDAIAEVILNKLYNFSPLQTNFAVNMLALDLGMPRLMNVKEVIQSFINFRYEIITKRTDYLLRKTREKAHILIGLVIAIDNIDEMIKLIRAAADTPTARKELIERYWQAGEVKRLIELVADFSNKIIDGKCQLTVLQANAILDMRLAKLTGLERQKLDNDIQKLAAEIIDYLDILSSKDRILTILKEELTEIKDEYATPRKTIFEENEYEYDVEDLIAKEDMVVTITVGGYIKRVPLSTYRAQKRGGKGRSGVNMKNEDATAKIYIANTHTPMLFFSNQGKVYKTKLYKLPLGSPQSRGRALVNIFPLQSGEVITNIMTMPEDEKNWDNLNIMFSTSKGNVRRSDMSDFKTIQSNGKIAIRLDADDLLVSVLPCEDSKHILLATKYGKTIRFSVSSLRVIKSRTSNGVKAIQLNDDDRVISMTILNNSDVDNATKDLYLKIPIDLRAKIDASLIHSQDELSDEEIAGLEKRSKELLAEAVQQTELPEETIKQLAKDEEFILTITENGYGKRTSSYEYRVTNRGGKGVLNIVTSVRNGNVIKSFPAYDNEQIMLITNSGQLIRCPVEDIRIMGRNTQGVKIFNTDSSETVVSASLISDV